MGVSSIGMFVNRCVGNYVATALQNFREYSISKTERESAQLPIISPWLSPNKARIQNMKPSSWQYGHSFPLYKLRLSMTVKAD